MDPSREIMLQALSLAKRGRGFVEPNPMVGAVIVDDAGHVVGRGFHQRFGDAHAEVNAIRDAGERARGGTLYVTLEPCCHTGKTPPCTDAILNAGIRTVVAAMQDPFPKVAGGGAKALRDAGVQVYLGFCETETAALNAPYLKRLATGRPWVHLKWAMSLDGKIATSTGDSKWITNEQSRAVAHELRGRMDAVLVGANTVRMDDPLLTARPPGPRTATRVILTTSGDLPERCQLLTTIAEAPVLVMTLKSALPRLQAWQQAGAEVIGLSQDTITAAAILDELGRRDMTNILVEGGAKLLGLFADECAFDEAHVFLAPKLIGGGPGPLGGRGVNRIQDALNLETLSLRELGDNLYLHALVKRLPNS